MARRASAQVKKDQEPTEGAAPSLEEDVEIDLADIEASPSQQVNGKTTEVEVEAPAPTVSQEDEEKVSMRKRLQEMEDADKLSREALLQARGEQQESARRQQEAETRAKQFEESATQAEYDGIVNTIGAAQSELDAAKQSLKTAGAEGNWDLIADAQERIGRFSASLDNLERYKNQLENARETQKDRPRVQPEPSQQRPADPVETAIAALPDRAKTWLRSHRDYLTDPEKNAALQHYHWQAKKEAGGEFSDAYFDRMEVHLGLRQDEQQSRSSPQQQRTTQVSAPPTRETPSMSTGKAPTPTRVTLNAEERQIAASMAEINGMTQAEAEREYAKQKLKMMDAKKSGLIS